MLDQVKAAYVAQATASIREAIRRAQQEVDAVIGKTGDKALRWRAHWQAQLDQCTQQLPEWEARHAEIFDSVAGGAEPSGHWEPQMALCAKLIAEAQKA